MTAFANFALKQIQLDMNPLFEAGFFGPDSVDLLEAACGSFAGQVLG